MDVMAQTAKKLANDMPVTQEELAAFVGTHGAPTLAGSTPAHVAGLLKERLYEMSMIHHARGEIDGSCADSAFFAVAMFAGLGNWGVEGSEDPLEDERPQRATEFNPLFDKRTVLTVDAKGSKTPFQHELDRVGQAQALNMLDEELLKREATFGPMKFPGWIEESGSFVYLEYLETHEENRKDCGGMTISMRRQSWVLSVPFLEESEDAATTKAASMIPKLLPYVPDNTTVTVGRMKEFGFSKTFAAVFCLEGTNLPTHARAGCPVHLFNAQQAPLDGSSVALIRLNPADDRHNEFATQVFDKAESAQGIKGDVAAVPMSFISERLRHHLGLAPAPVRENMRLRCFEYALLMAHGCGIKAPWIVENIGSRLVREGVTLDQCKGLPHLLQLMGAA